MLLWVKNCTSERAKPRMRDYFSANTPLATLGSGLSPCCQSACGRHSLYFRGRQRTIGRAEPALSALLFGLAFLCAPPEGPNPKSASPAALQACRIREIVTLGEIYGNKPEHPWLHLYSEVLAAAERSLASATIAMKRGSLSSDLKSGSCSISNTRIVGRPWSSDCRKSDSASERFPLRASIPARR